MTSPIKRPIPLGNRTAPGRPGGGLTPQGLAPIPPKRSSIGAWLFWLIMAPVLLLGLLWLLGRTVEPIRLRMEGAPVVGKMLFGQPVWPILWNAPAGETGTGSAGTADSPDTGSSGSEPSAPAPAGNLSALESELAARLAAVEVRENDLSAREQAVKEREQVLVEQETRLSDTIRETEAVRAKLEGQLRTEQDRVAVIRDMKSSAVQQLFGAMTDDEVITVLKYMEADETARILGAMDPYRAARILHKMTPISSTAVQP